MAIRKYRPTTPGRRGSSVADFAEITRSTPEKSLLRPLNKNGGRNNSGRITTRHKGGTGDHVLDVVSVTRGVDVSVVTLVGLVLDVSNVDGNAALALLGSGVDHTEVLLLVQVRELLRENTGDRSSQSGLTVVDVTDGTNVDVRLGALELCLSHYVPPRTFDGNLRWLSAQSVVEDGFLINNNGKFIPHENQRKFLGFDYLDGKAARKSRRAEIYSPRLFWMISSATAFGTSE